MSGLAVLALALWNPFLHLLSDELGQWCDLTFDTRGFEGFHVRIPPAHPDYRPRVASGCQQRVHQEATDAAVAVVVGVDKDKEVVAKHRANAGFGFRFEHVPQSFQRIQKSLAG